MVAIQEVLASSGIRPSRVFVSNDFHDGFNHLSPTLSAWCAPKRRQRDACPTVSRQNDFLTPLRATNEIGQFSLGLTDGNVHFFHLQNERPANFGPNYGLKQQISKCKTRGVFRYGVIPQHDPPEPR